MGMRTKGCEMNRSIVPMSGELMDVAPFPAVQIAEGVIGLIQSLSAEHTRRAVIEAQSRVLIARIENVRRENLKYLQEAFKERGLQLESIFHLLDRLIDERRGSSEGNHQTIERLLDLVALVMEKDPLERMRAGDPLIGFEFTGGSGGCDA